MLLYGGVDVFRRIKKGESHEPYHTHPRPCGGGRAHRARHHAQKGRRRREKDPAAHDRDGRGGARARRRAGLRLGVPAAGGRIRRYHHIRQAVRREHVRPQVQDPHHPAENHRQQGDAGVCSRLRSAHEREQRGRIAHDQRGLQLRQCGFLCGIPRGRSGEVPL